METNSWKTNIIDALFMPFEASQIKHIPLININNRDEITWHGTADGFYSVKSGYQAIIEWQDQKELKPNGNCSSTNNTIWKNLWNLPIPPKHSHLLWCIGHRGIPTNANLFNQNITLDPVCPRCNQSTESLDSLYEV